MKEKLIRDLALRDSVKRKEEEGKEFGASIMRFINKTNSSSLEIKSAIHVMANDHPTLQQDLMRFFLMFIEELSNKDATDLRNKDSINLAKEIIKEVSESDRILRRI